MDGNNKNDNIVNECNKNKPDGRDNINDDDINDDDSNPLDLLDSNTLTKQSRNKWSGSNHNELRASY
eukprot:80159-Ditylum_brightwellii.AAC.1